MSTIQERLLTLAEQHDLSSLSLRQIAKMAGIEHAQTVKYHLGKLVEVGKIKSVGGAMKVVIRGTEGGLLSLPILGSANCGTATRFAEEQVEGFIRVSPRLLPSTRDLFVVRAVGNSMDQANISGRCIEDGDYVVVKTTVEEPRDGDYVLSVIDGCANIKRFYQDKESGTVFLASESSEGDLHPPIAIHQDDDYLVNGRIVNVIKNPKRYSGGSDAI